MQKSSGKKHLLLVGILALICAAFLMGGVTMSQVSASSTDKTPTPTKPICSGSKTSTSVKPVCPGPGDLTKGVATITRVTGNTIQVKLLAPSENEGSLVILLTTAQTVYTPDRSIVAVGKNIGFLGTINSNGSITVQRLVSYDPSITDLRGAIVKIDGSTITLQEKSEHFIVHLTGSTTFLKIDPSTKQALPAAQSDLKVGENMQAQGKLNNDGSLTAVTVTIIPAELVTR